MHLNLKNIERETQSILLSKKCTMCLTNLQQKITKIDRCIDFFQKKVVKLIRLCQR